MKDGSRESAPLYRIRLWDPALRLFHWALAFCVAAAWILGEFGPGIMTLHFYFGYAVIGLLMFRLIWGLVGPWPARFKQFTYGPGTFLAYLRNMPKRRPSFWPGHNPVGALSVYALLIALTFQVIFGLFADAEDFINKGPLATPETAGFTKIATELHETLAPIILLLVVLHVGAIVFYKLWKHEDLVPSMITGKKVVRGPVPENRILEPVREEAA